MSIWLSIIKILQQSTVYFGVALFTLFLLLGSSQIEKINWLNFFIIFFSLILGGSINNKISKNENFALLQISEQDKTGFSHCPCAGYSGKDVTFDYTPESNGEWENTRCDGIW